MSDEVDTAAIVEMCVAFPLLLLYFGVWLFMLVRHPTKVALGINIMERQRWVDKIMFQTKGKEILGVQTCRNGTMAGSFFASSALIAAAAVLTEVADLGEKEVDLSFRDIKAVIVGMLFFFSFLSFSICVRHLNHLSFLICLSPEDVPIVLEDEPPLDPDSPELRSRKQIMKMFGSKDRQKAMRRIEVATSSSVTGATITFSIGLRFFYVALPVGLWIFGTPGLIVGTIALIATMAAFDYVWG